jgi:hypothetical protein
MVDDTAEAPRLTAFICGCGHSGTTLLATMLAMHSQVFVPLVETEIFLQPDDNVARQRVDELQRQALAENRPVVVEKTPRHIYSVPRIRHVIPGARFILMIRDGRDVATSLGKRFGGDFELGLRRWVNDNQFLRAELGKPDVILLRYEDLVLAPEQSLRELCRFLGVAFETQMLNYHERRHLWFDRKELRRSSALDIDGHHDNRNWQVNQPLFDGRGRWKTDLPPSYVERFKTGPIASRLMREFGYDPPRTALEGNP